MGKKFTFFLISVLFLLSCNGKKEKQDIDVSNIQVNLPYKNIGDELVKIRTKEDVDQFMGSHPVLAKQYFQVKPGNVDAQIKEFISKFYSNEELNRFNIYTDSSFKGYPLNAEITDLYKHVKYYYPNFQIPEVNTLVTGFNFDELSVSDSLIVIGLDYFIGPKAKYRPQLFNYMLERYDKPYIVPFIAQATSYKFNKENQKDETMLAHMIHHGKALYFMETMLPNADDTLLIMYPAVTLTDVNKNADVIYAHFVKNKLFFETKPKLIEKYVGESPKVDEIGEKCPGRIGRWLGWQIVRKYMEEHPEVTLQELMQETDFQKIFRESRYRPEHSSK